MPERGGERKKSMTPPPLVISEYACGYSMVSLYENKNVWIIMNNGVDTGPGVEDPLLWGLRTVSRIDNLGGRNP